jgi:hypothetical protein
VFTFALDDRLDLAVHSTEAGSQPGAMLHTRGTVQTRGARPARGDETLVEHRLDVQLLGADEKPLPADADAAGLLAAAAAPVLVRFAADGRVLGYGFAEDLDGDQRNFVRGLVGLFAIAAPRADVTQWTGPGQDTTGEFTAVHEQRALGDDVVVRRVRQHYVRVVGQDELPEHTLEGATEACFAVELGWLRSLRVDERLRMAVALLDLHTLAHRRTSLDCTAHARADLPQDVAAAWARATASVDGAGEVRGARAAEDERRRWQQRLQGTSLAALLQELQTLLAAAEVDSESVDARFQDLQWLLRLDDRASAALGELLASRQVDGAAARVAVGALGAAGTDAAQQQLIALRGDQGLGDELRHCATVSCLQLAKPNAALRADLLCGARGDSPHAESSLLVLGALATRGTAVPGEPSSLQSLLAMEGEATARGQLSTWLLAVANTRADVVEAIALRHLDHTDAQVRGRRVCRPRPRPRRHGAAGAARDRRHRQRAGGAARSGHGALASVRTRGPRGAAAGRRRGPGPERARTGPAAAGQLSAWAGSLDPATNGAGAMRAVAAHSLSRLRRAPSTAPRAHARRGRAPPIR